jgi:hypothetical protein
MFAKSMAAPAKAPATGLVASALRPDDGLRWQNGFAWRQEACASAQGFSPCVDPEDSPELGDTGLVHYVPNGYRLRDECTTLSERELDVARLRRRAEAVASYQVAQELWTGALTIADPFDVSGTPTSNPYFLDAATDIYVGTGDLVQRFADLEEAIRRRLNGQQAFIHIPVHLVHQLDAGGGLRRVGGLLYTALDTVVVADAGYPGTGATGGSTGWMFATGPVAVRLADLDIIEGMMETLSRTTNRQEIWASRLFAATYDPCVAIGTDSGVSVDIT